jgi:hypothetical protein
MPPTRIDASLFGTARYNIKVVATKTRLSVWQSKP